MNHSLSFPNTFVAYPWWPAYFNFLVKKCKHAVVLLWRRKKYFQVKPALPSNLGLLCNDLLCHAVVVLLDAPGYWTRLNVISCHRYPSYHHGIDRWFTSGLVWYNLPLVWSSGSSRCCWSLREKPPCRGLSLPSCPKKTFNREYFGPNIKGFLCLPH